MCRIAGKIQQQEKKELLITGTWDKKKEEIQMVYSTHEMSKLPSHAVSSLILITNHRHRFQLTPDKLIQLTIGHVPREV